MKRPRTLSAAFVRTVNRPGVYGDGRGGRGLSLRVHRTRDGRITKTWRQRVRIEGRLTSIGLGPYPEVTLAEARQKALDNSRGVLLGQDPVGIHVPPSCRPAPRQAGGPDRERGRARVSRADLELEARRRAEGSAPDHRRLPLVQQLGLGVDMIVIVELASHTCRIPAQ